MTLTQQNKSFKTSMLYGFTWLNAPWYIKLRYWILRKITKQDLRSNWIEKKINEEIKKAKEM